MIDICVGMGEQPAPLVRVDCEILHHVFVHFFLQIDTHGAVATNNLVGANAGVGRNISARIWNADVGGTVVHRMVDALHGGGN